MFGVAGDVFNFVKRVLNVRFEIGAGLNVVVLQRVAGENRQHRLHVQILAPIQKFQQAETIRGPITPRAAVAGPLRNVADGFLPVETLVDVLPSR